MQPTHGYRWLLRIWAHTLLALALVGTAMLSSGCGTSPCPTACQEGQQCQNGQCVSRCEGQKANCNGTTCIDTATNKDHCGSCGNSCSDGQVCQEGQCKSDCPDAQTSCGGTCTNLQTNKKHCGSCDNDCGEQTCNNGTCECPTGKTLCNDSCVDAQSDSKHCGSCGNQCRDKESCNAGECKLQCDSGQTTCDGSCVDTQSDSQHCGSCGKSCEKGLTCSSGTCQCPNNLKECNGQCVDAENNPSHCGACGNVCETGEYCSKGKCVMSCPKGQSECSSKCVELNTDALNCGSCGNICNSKETCLQGTCTLVCPKGQTNCNDTCVDLQKDKANCGACGTQCETGKSCNEGTCRLDCPTEQTNCNETCVNLKNDAKNCGACGKVCSTGLCLQGKCAPVPTSIALGSEHSCAVLSDGSAYCWGLNVWGQIGDRSNANRNIPVPVYIRNSNLKVKHIETGDLHTCGAFSDGAMYCWGEGSWERLGTGQSGDRREPTIVTLSRGLKLKEMATAYNSTCGIFDNNATYCWGSNTTGQIGNGTKSSSKGPTGVKLPTGRTAKQVTGGFFYHCALLDNGSIACWGFNKHGMLGDGTTSTRLTPVLVKLPSGRTAKQVRAGRDHACAILDNDSIACWGNNPKGQLGDGTNTNQQTPVLVKLPTGRTAKQLTTGYYHTCAILDNNAAYCWGKNSSGQLGIGSRTSQNLPTTVKLPTGRTVQQIKAGEEHTCAILDNKRVYCWGQNNRGQLGNNSTTSLTSPSQVPLLFCTSQQTHCTDACVDLKTDNNHCGACQNACPAGQTCQSGTCQ